MKTVGIIAEYNPFHNGHQYQIDTLRRQTGADYVIVAMSGNFLQRGVPAIMDKYARAKAALLSGVDLVLELPVIYATSSAEGFARGGVSMLASTGVITHLGFGVESLQDSDVNDFVTENTPISNVKNFDLENTTNPNAKDFGSENAPISNAKAHEISQFTQIAEILADEPEPYITLLRKHLKDGLSYPKARELALVGFLRTQNRSENTQTDTLDTTKLSAVSADYAPSDNHDVSAGVSLADSVRELLSSPNNILALEYVKALHTLGLSDTIRAVPVLRRGDGYHETDILSRYASATAIRQMLLEQTCDACRVLLPESSCQVLTEYRATMPFLSENSISALLGYRLHLLSGTDLSEFYDCSPQLAAKIQNNLPDYRDFLQFCDLLKSKDVTHTRICRTLLHILLDIRADEAACALSLTKTVHAPYLRVLGFRESAAPLLSAIKKEAASPLITKVADASRMLSDHAYEIFRKDLLASDIYRTLLSGHNLPENDFRRSPVIISLT